ncbi:AAA family ATPase [Microlunatus sp. GCM10028923]|uniref:AAA family ATPase n=1 Tax=Microlunatus sp. GCM10028923 TaxID=3273400 RepID=UPI003606EFD3
MASPSLIVVSGPPGSGKTTLAHRLAQGVGCPALCRDELKEGMVHAHPGFTPGPVDELNLRTLPAFFGAVEYLLRAGITVVAEAAYQDKLWRPGLTPLLELAAVRLVRCQVDPDTVADRIRRRYEENGLRAAAHGDLAHLAEVRERTLTFDPITLDVPTVDVDTTDGYRPGLPELINFARERASR